MRKASIIIAGAGIFGVMAAVELCRRGWAVKLIDPGPLPHPLAASTDISKVVRMEYGPDVDYTLLAEGSLEGWRAWNRDLEEELFYETGVLFARSSPLAAGTFEYESFRLLQNRGHPVEQLDEAEIRRRFPAWNAAEYPYAIFNPLGGYARSGRVVERLLDKAAALGVEIHVGPVFKEVLATGDRAEGILTEDGTHWLADQVVIAMGAWTPFALPDLAPVFRTVGMPVFHLQPVDRAPFEATQFPVFGADISRTGYYGFPASLDGIVKFANHGTGRAMHPHSPERVVTEEEIARLRKFLSASFPFLATAPIVYTRVCLYCDTLDGNFWIAPDPGRKGLVVAAGGSGHAFKFAPMLGGLIADAVEGRENEWTEKFRWRPEIRRSKGQEAARLSVE